MYNNRIEVKEYFVIKHQVGDIHTIDKFVISKNDTIEIDLSLVEKIEDINLSRTDVITFHGESIFNSETFTVSYTPSPYYPSDKILIQLDYVTSHQITYTVEISIYDSIENPNPDDDSSDENNTGTDDSTSDEETNTENNQEESSNNSNDEETNSDDSTSDEETNTENNQEESSNNSNDVKININPNSSVTADLSQLINSVPGSEDIINALPDNIDDLLSVFKDSPGAPFNTLKIKPNDIYEFDKPIINADSPLKILIVKLHPNLPDSGVYWEKEIHNYKVAIYYGAKPLVGNVWSSIGKMTEVIKIERSGNTMLVRLRKDLIDAINSRYPGMY
jgi:hypothetical protein